MGPPQKIDYEILVPNSGILVLISCNYTQVDMVPDMYCHGSVHRWHSRSFQPVGFGVVYTAVLCPHSTAHRGAFCSFLSGGFIIAIVLNPPERKLAKRTSVKCVTFQFLNIQTEQN